MECPISKIDREHKSAACCNGIHCGRLTLTDGLQNLESMSFAGTTDGLPFSCQIATLPALCEVLNSIGEGNFHHAVQEILILRQTGLIGEGRGACGTCSQVEMQPRCADL